MEMKSFRVPPSSPLNCLLDNWSRLDPQVLKDNSLSPVLNPGKGRPPGNNNQWSPGQTFYYALILQLELLCEWEEKTSVLYVQLFLYIQDHPDLAKTCKMAPLTLAAMCDLGGSLCISPTGAAGQSSPNGIWTNCGHWPTLLNAEANSDCIFTNYGTLLLWKITSCNCKVTSCVLTIQVPWLNEAINYPIDKLMGLGEIIQNKQTSKQKHAMPTGHWWAILRNKTKHNGTMLENDIWLRAEQAWDPDFTQTWLRVSTTMQNFMWYMKNGIYYWVGLTNDTIVLINFLFEVSTHPFKPTGLSQSYSY